jgi:hypothetical protein
MVQDICGGRGKMVSRPLLTDHCYRLDPNWEFAHGKRQSRDRSGEDGSPTQRRYRNVYIGPISASYHLSQFNTLLGSQMLVFSELLRPPARCALCLAPWIQSPDSLGVSSENH